MTPDSGGGVGAIEGGEGLVRWPVEQTCNQSALALPAQQAAKQGDIVVGIGGKDHAASPRSQNAGDLGKDEPGMLKMFHCPLADDQVERTVSERESSAIGHDNGIERTVVLQIGEAEIHAHGALGPLYRLGGKACASATQIKEQGFRVHQVGDKVPKQLTSVAEAGTPTRKNLLATAVLAG